MWLALIGFTVWEHARASDYPPLYDALSYYQKAKNVWDSVDQHRFVNPLDLDPVFRPPGTVLMSYPFGFTADFRPFHFRSVYIPILCLIGALYVVGFTSRVTLSRHWNVALLAMSLSSLPMFYHFELVQALGSPGNWGLVDTFLAGLAGLAAAACVRSITTLSLHWAIGGSLLAAFCLLVKPSGLIVMGLAGAGWLGTLLVVLAHPGPISACSRGFKRLLLVGAAAMSVIFATTIYLCFTSKYLSPQTIAFGEEAVRVLQTELPSMITPDVLYSLVRTSFGYPPLIILVAALILASAPWKDFAGSDDGWSMAGLTGMALVSFLVGCWFWLVRTGVTQIRYFYPFAIIALICLMPHLLLILDRMSTRRLSILRLLLLLPALNMAVLLLYPSPSPAWQQASGVSLTTGTAKSEIFQASAFLNEVRKGGRTVRLYSLHSPTSDQVFSSVGGYEYLLHPTSPTYIVQRPIDWQRSSTYRIRDILDSEYILFTPITEPSERAQALARHTIDNFQQESLLFHAWFTDLSEKDGVSVVSESSARLLKITDLERLEASLTELEATHTWPTAFQQANPPRWWNVSALHEALKNTAPLSRDIVFGNVIKVHAISMTTDGATITVLSWWEALRAFDLQGWLLVLELLDQRGRTVAAQSTPLFTRKSAHSTHPIRLSTVDFTTGSFLSTTGVPEVIAVSIYRPTPTVLYFPAQRGRRDRDNQRVLVPLPDHLR